MELDRPTWYEFFAGGGMARLGLGPEWRCTFANEWCEKKASAYQSRFGVDDLRVCDIADLTVNDLPGVPTLAWASFPCQDLSLAGNGAGLQGQRSGTFKPFWKLMQDMARFGREPGIVVLENVVGTLSSHDGRDFSFIIDALADEGYRVGALVIDAVRFLPQSRPRLFVVGAHRRITIPSTLMLPLASEVWHPTSLRSAFAKLPAQSKVAWVWWSLPAPREPAPSFSSLIEDEPTNVEWHTEAQTEHIIRLMSALHRDKLHKAQRLGRRIVGTVYRRTRPNEEGASVQRAEIRFDQISGCLRTPAGGSSRQTIVVVQGNRVRSRLLSPREAARLMGVPDDYPLPARYNDAYHLFGDGVAVPVVRWLSRHLLLPLAAHSQARIAA